MRFLVSIAMLLFLGWPLGAQPPNFGHGHGRYLDSPRGKIYIEVEGTGPPVLLVAGGPGNSHIRFHPWFSQLAKAEGEGKEKHIAQWRPFIGLQGPLERIREAAKLATKGRPEEEDPGWHDLRRTFVSVGADLGLKGFVGELIGHAEQTVTDIYTRAAAERLKDAAEAIGSRIEGILSGGIDSAKEAEARRQEKANKLKAGS